MRNIPLRRPIGVCVVQFARLAGARHVVVSETSEERCELALTVGASAAIDPGVGDLAEQVIEKAAALPDIVFECVGVPGLIDQAISACAVHATGVVVGVCFQWDHFMPVRALMREATIRFSNCYSHDDFDEVLNALARGDIDPSAMHTRTLTLDEVPEAFEALRFSKTGCKTLIGLSGGKL